MARVNKFQRRNPLSQVAAAPEPQAGQGFAAIAEMAQIGANFVRPKALEQAAIQGAKSVYRDENGILQVDDKNILGGEMADAHNSAAFAKYMSQRKIDMGQSFTEMAVQHQYDPEGFRAASDAYVKLLQEDENIPDLLKEDLISSARQEASNRFNGIYVAETARTQREADRDTKTHRDMLADDYINLMMDGDLEGAEEKLKEIEGVTKFRESADYISETPAETEAYLRGVKGAASAARLTRTLEGLSGQSSIEPEVREQVQALLDDPNISPQVRQRLYSATQGRLKGIDGRAIADRLARSDYGSKVIKVESGGNPTAKNPLSSALGPHQFIKSTWLENVKEVRARGGAKWAAGLSNTELLGMRTDMAASTEIFEHFSGKNEGFLRTSGVPVDDGTKYMAHFFGAGGAVKVLKADPSALVRDTIPGIVKANPFMANMTNAEARRWASRKMTVKASDMAASRAEIDRLEDDEVKAAASSAWSQHYQTRRRLEDQAALGYKDRISAQDDALTEMEILHDDDLADEMQQALIRELRDSRGQTLEVEQTAARLADPGASFDPFDAGDRRKVDNAYKFSIGEDGDPLSIEGQTVAAQIVSKTGFMPKTAFNAIRGAVNGQDPERFAGSMEFLSQVLQREPAAIHGIGGASELRNAMADYKYYSGFMGGAEAAARVIENNSPEMVAKRKNLSDAAKEAKKELKPGDVVDFFHDAGASVTLGTETQQGAVMADYERLFEDAFIRTGDAGLAKNRALTEMSRIYGPNAVTGESRVMRYPPQNFYPKIPSNPNWMQEQIVSEVKQAIGMTGDGDKGFMDLVGDAIGDSLPFGLGDEITASDITLMPDKWTRDDVNSNRPPSYTVWYQHKGQTEVLPGRFRFEPPTVDRPLDAEGMAKMEQSHADAASVHNLRLWADHFQSLGMGRDDAVKAAADGSDELSGRNPSEADEQTARQNGEAWIQHFVSQGMSEDAARRKASKNLQKYLLTAPPTE